MSDNKVKLEPCWYQHEEGVISYPSVNDGERFRMFCVHCAGCGARGPERRTAAEAGDEWNRVSRLARGVSVE